MTFAAIKLGLLAWVSANINRGQPLLDYRFTPDDGCPDWMRESENKTCLIEGECLTQQIINIPVTCEESINGQVVGFAPLCHSGGIDTACGNITMRIGDEDQFSERNARATVGLFSTILNGEFQLNEGGMKAFKKRSRQAINIAFQALYEHEKNHVKQSCPYKQLISNWQLAHLAILTYPTHSRNYTRAFTEAFLAAKNSGCVSTRTKKLLNGMLDRQQRYYNHLKNITEQYSACKHNQRFSTQLIFHESSGIPVEDVQNFFKLQEKRGKSEDVKVEHSGIGVVPNLNNGTVLFTHAFPSSIKQIAYTKQKGSLYSLKARLTQEQHMAMVRNRLETSLKNYQEFIPPGNKTQPINLSVIMSNANVLKELEVIIQQMRKISHMETKLECLKPRAFEPRKGQHDLEKMQFDEETGKMAKQLRQALGERCILSTASRLLFTTSFDKEWQQGQKNAEKFPLLVNAC